LPGEQFPAEERRLEIRASSAIEYFVPQPMVAHLATMVGRDRIAVRLPAHHGETRLHLGRVMSVRAPQFTLDRGDRRPRQTVPA
jgi:hypothetical protein